MIPTPMLLIVWLLATTSSAAASYTSFKKSIKSMGFAFAGFAFGAFSVASFYFMLEFTDLPGNLNITVPWSRWANLINGVSILSAGVAAYIVVKDR